MRVLLISPNREISPDPVYPLGLASLAAVLKAGGITVKGSDLCFHPDWGKVLEQDLESFRPDCIGLSIRNIDNVTYPRSTAYLPFIKEVVELCRRKTTAPIVVGGSGFTLLPEGVLDFLDADYGVVGEGERAFLDLLGKMAGDRLPRPSAEGSPPVPSRDRMVTGKPIKELNALPWPDRETFDAGAYREQGGLANIQSKRGCPFHCIYCTYPLIEGRNVRVREPLGVVREIQALVDRGLDYIFFVDNNFNFPEEQAEGICREIIRQKVPVRWTAYVNPGFMTDRLGEAMKASGCAALEFGLDAAAPKQLDALGKNFSVLQIREAARICREQELLFCFSLLMGGPGETRATLEETLAQAADLNPTAVICMTGIRVFPGTRLAEIARKEGLLPENWNPLEPFFYLSPEVRDHLESRLLEFSEVHPNWIFPGLGIDLLPGEAAKMHRLGLKGPLWVYLRPKKRKKGGLINETGGG
ncbi:MAG: radical SAM protein [Desulfobacteraceae bacterium]|nr:MAG: radical SAM protein [Desulfobacteraceae bacterium]